MDLTLIIMTVGWIFVAIWIPIVIAANRKQHPKALFILFFAEMWERFSYYGMRALLTLYMVGVLFRELSQGDADAKALGIYGSYTAMVYLFPVIGGMIADRIFGFRKAVIVGGVLMMLGHFSLALQGMFYEDSVSIFFLSLALIIVGNGYFKPNISSFLGKFYEKDDNRKDGAFTIFYMGVNIGAFLATLTCGYVGETINWHYGFGLAGIGMALGLLVFWIMGPRVFEGKGLVPTIEEGGIKKLFGLDSSLVVWVGTLLLIPICAGLLDLNTIMTNSLLALSILIIGYLIYTAFQQENKKDTQRLLVVVVLFFFHAVFWALFEQAGGSLTLFTLRNVDRTFFGNEIPASIFQSLNPFYIMVLAPVFSWIWISLSNRKREPSTPMKFVLGLAQLAFGFLIIVIGAKVFSSNGLVPVVFLFLMYLFHTTGELSLSPVGLSMVTKLSPDKIVGFVMGAWFLSIAVANKIAGAIGALTASSDISADSPPIETLGAYTEIYMTWGVYVVGGAAVFLLLLVPMLRKWMHGIH